MNRETEKKRRRRKGKKKRNEEDRNLREIVADAYHGIDLADLAAPRELLDRLFPNGKVPPS